MPATNDIAALDAEMKRLNGEISGAFAQGRTEECLAGPRHPVTAQGW